MQEEGRRPSAKQPLPGALRAKLREEAVRLARQRRQDVLQRYRRAKGPESVEGEIRAAVRQALSFVQIQPAASQPAGNGNSAWRQPQADDLWDPDALLISEEQLHAIEQDLLEEILEHEMAMWEQEASAAASAAAELNNNGCGSDGRVPCPICHSCSLVQTQLGVCCPSEGWHLSLSCEGPMLAYARDQLAAAYEAHSRQQVVAGDGSTAPCLGSLRFKLEEVIPTYPSLVARCDQCQMLRVIL